MAYALGGLGSSFAFNDEELTTLSESPYLFSPQVPLKKSLKRVCKKWKYYEVVCDSLTTASPYATYAHKLRPSSAYTQEKHSQRTPSQALSSIDYRYLPPIGNQDHPPHRRRSRMQCTICLRPIFDGLPEVIAVNARLSRSPTSLKSHPNAIARVRGCKNWD